MFSSVRRVFRSKSKPDKTPTVKEKSVPEPSPAPIAQTRTTFFYSGIQTFHSTESDNIDIVFVHGLKGDCQKTWTDKSSGNPWPKTLLPLEIETARVITYSYDSTVTGKEDVPSQNRISNHAYNLVTALASLRQSDNTNERPIIFVCHSLGGLVCQDALVTAKQRSEQHLQDIVNFTRGVIFLGTPHHGSSLAKIGELVSRSVGLIKETNSDIVQVLTRDSEVLARIQDSFQALLMTRSKDEATMIDITCFYEELPTKKFGVIVPKHSAILPGYISIGIHKNHAEMTKFSNSEEPGFVAICGELKRWMKRIQQTQSKPQKHASAAHCLVPYTFNPDFVGRSEILDLLKSQLGDLEPRSKGRGHRRAALYGLGGVGKTQIALSYAYWVQEVSQDTSVFWVHASSAERFSEGYANIANECKIPGYEDPRFDVLPAVKDWLESDESGQWLMVIDNADDMELFFPQNESPKMKSNAEKSLGQFIPQCAHGNALITTRNMQVGSRLTKGKFPIEVGKMDEHEAAQLLRQGLHQEGESEQDLLQLSSRLEFLPLALVQAAAFIQENSITVNEYLELLDGSEDDLIDLLNEEFETVGRDSGTPRAVAQTWMLSFQQIEKQYPFASELLSLMCLFDRQKIPLDYVDFHAKENLPPGSNIKMQLVKALGVLKAFCFIRPEKGGDHTMHRLIQLVTRTWLVRKGNMVEFTRHAFSAVSDFYPYASFQDAEWWVEDMRTCNAHLSHAKSVLEIQIIETEEDKLIRASVLHRVASFFGFQGRSTEAETLQSEAVDIRLEVYGEEHEQTLYSMTDLATSLAEQGQWDKSERMLENIIESLKRLHGDEHHQTIGAMNTLAWIFSGQGKKDESIALFSHVFEVGKRILGEEHSEVINAMSNLAIMSEGEEAEEMQRRVLELRIKNYGEENPRTLDCKESLAITLYNKGGHLGEAEDLQVEVFEARKRILGKAHPDTLQVMNDLGCTWLLFGQLFLNERYLYPDVDMLGDAKRLLEECLPLRINLLGPDHEDTVETRTALEDCLEALEVADLIDAEEKAAEVDGKI
ncbi:Protein SERAC1 [Fusarium oxysporum f. sp. cubense]|uniref:Protein SERAC1 n=1 Tax=Fusarium oxysporum f. sp. cubense TaxID=61366 RepID=A0A559KXU9_FUSOC|nr:Protein SERAC1 [Fusarium oxysporum f. sp. cubense]